MEKDGASNGHQRKTEATRAALLSSARRIFARDGFEAARIADIAAGAGHTRGAFYANFEAKEDLFFALLEQEANARLRHIRSALESSSDPEQRLRSLRAYYLKRAADRYWVLLMLEFKLFALRHPELRPKLASTHRRIRASLKIEAIDRLLPQRMQGDPQSESLRKVALEAILNGLVLEHLYDPHRISKQQVMFLLGALFDVLLDVRAPFQGLTERRIPGVIRQSGMHKRASG